ncbi:hypothetical protein GFB64_04575 [Lacticaseibacillus paracasei]|nr:hypothetical protein GFB64_04575 [Lacticaseibacillus paracasei]
MPFNFGATSFSEPSVTCYILVCRINYHCRFSKPGNRLFFPFCKTRTLKRIYVLLIDFYKTFAYLSTWCFE